MDCKLKSLGWLSSHSATYSLPDDVDKVSEDVNEDVFGFYYEYIFKMGGRTRERELSFTAYDSPPYLMAKRSADNATFHIEGALYSLYVETAKKLNYR